MNNKRNGSQGNPNKYGRKPGEQNRNNFVNKQQTYLPEEYTAFFDRQEDRTNKIKSIKLDKEHMHMLPLGGIGEIGMNSLLYQYMGRWMMIDCGNSFDKLYKNSAHVVVPSVEFIAERLDDFEGIFLTHGHEDHIGALPYVWKSLECPIYGTKFTNTLVRRKFEERGMSTEQIIDIEVGKWYDFGPFQIKWISVSHSIPGSCMIAIRTPLGSVLHTGDWKIDNAPAINEITDFESIKQLAQEDLHAIVSDSTNIMVDGFNPTEQEVCDSLIDLLGKIRKGKIFVTFFSTNISRLHACIEAGKKSGRKVAVLGRALQRSYETAVETGYLEHSDLVIFEGIDNIPSDQLIIACSGSQGEERSALRRIAMGTHKFISIEEGDTVIFSCRLIPTNAKEVVTLENDLMRRGAKVITNKDALIHSSGHARKEEFEQFYDLIKTNAKRKIWSLPCHGTTMFLERHSRFAQERGFLTFSEKESFHDGKIYRIAPTVEYVDEIDHQIYFVDGTKLVSTDSPVLEERRSLYEGFIGLVVVVSNGRRLAYSHITSYGVDEDRNWIENEIRRIVSKVFDDLDANSTPLNRQIRSKISSFTRFKLEKKVHIDLHIINDSNIRRK